MVLFISFTFSKSKAIALAVFKSSSMALHELVKEGVLFRS